MFLCEYLLWDFFVCGTNVSLEKNLENMIKGSYCREELNFFTSFYFHTKYINTIKINRMKTDQLTHHFPIIIVFHKTSHLELLTRASFVFDILLISLYCLYLFEYKKMKHNNYYFSLPFTVYKQRKWEKYHPLKESVHTNINLIHDTK